jgi:uncharacterized membrane protein
VRFFSKHIFTGLVTVLPVFLTVYLLYWMTTSTERVLGAWIRELLPAISYWPGMGLAAAVLGLMLVGLLMHAYVVRRLFAMTENLLYHVPVIKSVYGAFSDFFTYFSPRKQRDFHQVVTVDVTENLRLIGFLTRGDASTLPEELRGDDNVLVYLPLSYQIGGYTVAVPRSAVQPVGMTMEQAMRFTLTAGVTGDLAPQPDAPTPKHAGKGPDPRQ